MSFNNFQRMLAQRVPGAFFKPIGKEESTNNTASKEESTNSATHSSSGGTSVWSEENDMQRVNRGMLTPLRHPKRSRPTPRHTLLLGVPACEVKKTICKEELTNGDYYCIQGGINQLHN
jgi:hypothetical protein